MKKVILIAFISTLAIGTKAQTTQEEYNYVTKGYKVQVESGLDMKKGYELKDIDHVQQAGSGGSIAREAWLKILNRKSTSTIASYMIIYQRPGKEKEYFCVPSPNSSQVLRDAFFASLTAADTFGSTDKLQLLTFLLSRSLTW